MSSDTPAVSIAPLSVFTDDDELAAPDVHLTEFVIFSVSGAVFAIRVDDVEEIIRQQESTYVPRANSFVIGITSLRGKIIPLLSLDILLGGGEPDGGDLEQRWKIMVIREGDESIGLKIDRDVNISGLADEAILPSPSNLSELTSRFTDCVVSSGGRFIPIVKTSEIFKTKAALGGR